MLPPRTTVTPGDNERMTSPPWASLGPPRTLRTPCRGRVRSHPTPLLVSERLGHANIGNIVSALDQDSTDPVAGLIFGRQEDFPDDRP